MTRDELNEIRKKVQIYLDLGRYDASEKLLKLALEEYGSAANIRNLLGFTYHRQSNFKDALDQFDLALKDNSEFTEAILNMAITLADLGLYEDATSFFQRAEATISLQHGVPNLILGRLANHHADTAALYEVSGMKQQALIEYRKALGLYSEMPDVRVKLARLLIELRDFEGARSELRLLEKLEINSVAPLLWLGVISFITGSPGLAGDLWHQARKLKPTDRVTRAFSSLAYFIGRDGIDEGRKI